MYHNRCFLWRILWWVWRKKQYWFSDFQIACTY